MIIVICDTQKEKDNMIDCINSSDYCPFDKLKSCSIDYNCEECLLKKMKFIVKEDFE